ncbi:VTT domain-containing protein [Loigolactobacillus backii]|uniref:Cytochrome O ubiquinol oxidase n=1 Tax=Loigolactobacillus backii TaxID=375175 RepID=A0A192H1I8_9LACO|nr:VTT domain-containing protein [Loigolactobacillus backii]ANK59261.1 cytochrome O ubiquinol oxidase [Loigolactobacillus backii]ANK62674.1 cytochrome O ubiquinol oxidase [Loigolactobacillus backii]ANK64252.1 cytochrome O ubiquinol oxidase [Loigolactobacillus backii]ANK67354.1 cytochrome O ubiquinol oxidase [Loigolactobacillus backii]ANK70318.1 cytochrome O ubiquinol oxidase [Loigolactobacillus backii]
MPQLIDFVLNIDTHLVTLVNSFGNWSYLILFLLIFIETGVVVLPFLPGDSLLFAASALAANSAYHLNIWLLFATFFTATVLGDTLNYEIGRLLGTKAANYRWFNRFIDKQKMAQAEQFFNRHGGKAIAIARFMPIVRTFIPFISGGSHMNYRKFSHYNVLGGFLWVTVCLMAGHFFGNMPFVQEHFSIVVVGIVAISLIPVLITLLRRRHATDLDTD